MEDLIQFETDGLESLVHPNMYSLSPPPPSPQENLWAGPALSWPGGFLEETHPEETLPADDPPLSPPSGIDPHMLHDNSKMMVDEEEGDKEVAGKGSKNKRQRQRDWNKKGKRQREDSDDEDELESEDEMDMSLEEEEEVSPEMAEARQIVEPDVMTQDGSTSAQGYHMLVPFYRLSKEDQQVMMKISEAEVFEMYKERIEKKKKDMDEMRSPQPKRMRRTSSPSPAPFNSDHMSTEE